jgi:DNA-binding NarL/FixJ family response regulator
VAKVLVVDRNQDRQFHLVQCLQNVPGLTIAPAREELATVHLLKNARPEVIMLGTDDGDSWMLALLAAAAPQTPILAYTDRWDLSVEKRALTSGARELLSTAASRSDYLKAITDVLRVDRTAAGCEPHEDSWVAANDSSSSGP